MEIKTLHKRSDIDQSKKLSKAYSQFENLIAELKAKELPDTIKTAINEGLDEINTSSESEKGLRKLIRKTQSSILNLLERELKIVPKNHFRNTWMAIGMGTFGIPLGAAFGVSMGNMGLIGIGLPIGMAIGMAVGTGMDKKAMEEGRQLDIQIEL